MFLVSEIWLSLHRFYQEIQLVLTSTDWASKGIYSVLKRIEKFRLNWPRSLMDRASDYGSEGWGFDSLRGHTLKIRRLQGYCKRLFYEHLHTICTQDFKRRSLDLYKEVPYYLEKLICFVYSTGLNLWKIGSKSLFLSH